MSSGVTIILPDGSERILGGDATGADLAADLGGRAAKEALIAVADGVELDLNRPYPMARMFRLSSRLPRKVSKFYVIQRPTSWPKQF